MGESWRKNPSSESLGSEIEEIEVHRITKDRMIASTIRIGRTVLLPGVEGEAERTEVGTSGSDSVGLIIIIFQY